MLSLNGDGIPGTRIMTRQTAKVMFAVSVAYPMKVAALHARYRATIVPLVSAQRVHPAFYITKNHTVWGECSHVFHMHCLLKWIGTPASKQQCPMDRRTWGTLPLSKYATRVTEIVPVTAERKVPPQQEQGQ